MRYHLTFVRRVMIEKEETSVGEDCGEKGALVHSWWGREVTWLPWKRVGRFLKKLKLEQLQDPQSHFWV